MMKVLLAGTGFMAKEYARVLLGLNCAFNVVGRGEERVTAFKEEFPSVDVISGGLENYSLRHSYTHAIVATNVDSLFSNCKHLIEKGIRQILVEKPGGLGTEEIKALAELAEATGTNILLAYNRRFFATVIEAQRMIEEDGGVLSFHFEFTEWQHSIEAAGYSDPILQSLFVSHSSHLADTAFYLGGKPAEWNQYRSGKMSWHDTGSIFTGAGVCTNGALFSYCANWNAPGRWGIEIMTAKRRIILRPMEMLQVQEHRSVRINEITIDDSLDKTYKPGLYLQTKAFLEGDKTNFTAIKEQYEMVAGYYNLMAGYK